MEANTQKPITDLKLDILPKATAEAFKKCAGLSFFSRGGWYLAGGTALALQAGHRQSVDLDFFTEEKKFNEKKAEETLSSCGRWFTNSISKGTVYGEFFGAKISLISYPFFKPRKPIPAFGAVSIITPSDIAVMKIIAISQRGRKRDFFDLYWLCKNAQPLEEILSNVNRQYIIQQNPTHILKSLVYFEDAENDPNPKIYFSAKWRDIKKFFEREVSFITKNLLS